MKNYRKKWLLIDTNFLCYRAWYTTGRLEHDGEGTGVIFGVMKTIEGLCELHGTQRLIFAFDHGPLKRSEIYPAYKANRETDEAKERFKAQVDKLRDVYLPEAGFENVWHEPGYEADDIIAHVVQACPRGQACIIVSTDKDLYQLLRQNVWVWNVIKGRPYTIDDFQLEWNIPPGQWADVKAIAGCDSDNITGVEGVAEKTAIKFLRHEMNPETATYRKIAGACSTSWAQNLELVRLPFPGLPPITKPPSSAPIDSEKWNAVAEQLGMKSAIRKPLNVKKGFGLGS